VTAITPSSTVQAFTATVVFPNGLVLPTGYTLRASTHNAESCNVVAEGGNY
jgi:invasion protein IalB